MTGVPPGEPRRIGSWLLQDEIGRGAFGIVHRVRHAELGTEAALKTVRSADPEIAGSLRREIHALARLCHPGVVRILDRGVEAGMPWYAMELHRGTTLRERAHQLRDATPGGRRLSTASLRTILTLLRRLCIPLGYLHGEGVVHRDLKPTNVVVGDGDLPVIVDFGLMMEVERGGRELLQVLGASGTLAFMSPEQIRGEAVDARSDLFALGAMAHVLLTGTLPFATTADVAAGVPPPPPSSLVGGIPPSVDAIVAGLLRADPAERTGHASDVARALEAAGASSDGYEGAPPARDYLYRPALAGRGDLVAELLAFVRASLARRGAVVLVGGESGIGKTRLAMEVAQRAAVEGARTATGECLPAAATAGPPLGALQPLLSRIAATCLEDPEAAGRVVGARATVLSAVVPELGSLGVGATEEPLPAAEARHRLLAYLAETLAAFSRESPLLLVVDDLQWADGLTLDLLRILVRRGTEGLVVIGTYRTDEVGDGLARLVAASPRNLVLGGLDEAAIGRVAADMLCVRTPDPDLVRFLATRSDGNPFFVAEYLRASVQEALLVRAPGGNWGLAPGGAASYDALELPVGLRALVLHRLATLSAEALALLEAAAILGRESPIARIAEVAGREEASLDGAISELVGRQVLEAAVDVAGRQRGSVVRFIHDQLREAAYERIDDARRRELHGRAAGAIASAPGADRDASLGHHWEGAGELDLARSAYLASAREASSRYALDAAERLFRDALRLSSTTSAERVVARLELAEGVLAVTGKTRQGQEESARSAAEARALGEEGLLARALRASAAALSVLGRVEEAVLAYDEALVIYQRLGDAKGEALTVRYLGILAVQQGRLHEARVRFGRALELYRGVGDGENEGIVLGNLATAMKSQGQNEEALPLFEQAIARHRTHGNRRFLAIDTQNRAGLLQKLGRIAEAIPAYEEAIAGLRGLGDRRFEAIGLANLGLTLEQQGRLPEALPRLERAIALFREVGDQRSEAIATQALGSLRRQQGEREVATELYARAAEACRAIGDRRALAAALASLAGLRRERGELSAAEELGTEALENARATGVPDQQAAALGVLSICALDRGDVARARELGDAAVALARRVGEPRTTGLYLVERALVERRSMGDLEAAGSMLEEAADLLESSDAVADLASCRCAQGMLALARDLDAGPFLVDARELAERIDAPAWGGLAAAIRELAHAVEERGTALP